ncbi:MAG: helix-turn-helix domain-containing protein [Myxococcota bacterium]
MSHESDNHTQTLRPVGALRGRQLHGGMVILSFALDDATVGTAVWERLSPAQAEVVGYMLDGLSDVQIAARRGCSRHTVSNLLRSAYQRLGVASRSELAALLHGGGRLP